MSLRDVIGKVLYGKPLITKIKKDFLENNLFRYINEDNTKSLFKEYVFNLTENKREELVDKFKQKKDENGFFWDKKRDLNTIKNPPQYNEKDILELIKNSDGNLDKYNINISNVNIYHVNGTDKDGNKFKIYFSIKKPLDYE